MLLYSRCSMVFQWFRTITFKKKKKHPQIVNLINVFTLFSLWSTLFTLFSISWGNFRVANLCRYQLLSSTTEIKHEILKYMPLPFTFTEGGGIDGGDSTLGRRLVWGLVVTLTPWRSSLCWWWVQLWPPSAPATPGPGLCCWWSVQQTCRRAERASATRLMIDLEW